MYLYDLLVYLKSFADIGNSRPSFNFENMRQAVKECVAYPCLKS